MYAETNLFANEREFVGKVVLERLTDAVLRGAVRERLNVLRAHLLNDVKIARGDHLRARRRIMTREVCGTKIFPKFRIYLFDDESGAFGDFDGGGGDAEESRRGAPHFGRVVARHFCASFVARRRGCHEDLCEFCGSNRSLHGVSTTQNALEELSNRKMS